MLGSLMWSCVLKSTPKLYSQPLLTEVSRDAGGEELGGEGDAAR